MITIESDDIFDYSAAAVFALLADLGERSTWMTPAWIVPGATGDRVTPLGPARMGTSLTLGGKFGGEESGTLLFVTEFEQDRLLTLATSDRAQLSYRESYRIEPLSEGTCRVYSILEVGGIPKFGEFFMRPLMQKEQPHIVAHLKAALAGQAHQAG